MIWNPRTEPQRFFLLATLLAAALSIAGCGGGSDSASTDEAASAGGSSTSNAAANAEPEPAGPSDAPEVGASAPDFELTSLTGETVSLADRLEQGPVVLLVLRGYPGYQCPICSRQFGDFLANADAFAEANAQVLMVYPGSVDDLKAKAGEFVKDNTLPDHYNMLLDPGYTFTNAFGLRWDAPEETAYPATFVIDQDGTVRWAKISDSHGNRAEADDVLDAVEELGPSQSE